MLRVFGNSVRWTVQRYKNPATFDQLHTGI